MPYTLYKTNGVKLTVVEDGTLNLTTDLELVGKNYAGYGQSVNSDLIKLLENFANDSAPSKPLVGQIWYDTTTQKIKYYTGSKWNSVSSTNISTTTPTDIANGEFWYDTNGLKLYIKYNGTFYLIGPGLPNTGGTTQSAFGSTPVLSDTTVRYNVIKLQINDSSPAVVSSFNFNVDPTDPLFTQFSKVKNGITLSGADPVTGVSSSTFQYFWGTAADALRLGGKNSTDFLQKTEVGSLTGNITTLTNITRISTGSPSTPGTIEGAWSLTAGSTLQATYADVAERYHADAEYGPGTVLVIGGDFEVTISTKKCDPAVAGIVSTNPAYKLNSDAGTDKTHPYVALKGRVPCKVVGNIKKGDMLITSAQPGVACAMVSADFFDPNAVIGRALEDYASGLVGVIEVKV